ncbi:MAG TPA: prepilin-type N-terminal cleavage/methylation domain-containing protein [Bacilli bacterium]|nr:prepilin-type N-terminal cleavage/methylation domain-containing protein [Bacilli bacterium]
MNNKGFTLVELLAIMVLLTAIALIAMPIIDKHIDEAREKTYQTNISKIIDATKNWMIKYSGEVEFADNGTTRTYDLNLDSLKETEYLDNVDIINPHTNENMEGCIRITEDKNLKYNYEYNEECKFDE